MRLLWRQARMTLALRMYLSVMLVWVWPSKSRISAALIPLDGEPRAVRRPKVVPSDSSPGQRNVQRQRIADLSEKARPTRTPGGA